MNLQELYQAHERYRKENESTLTNVRRLDIELYKAINEIVNFEIEEVRALCVRRNSLEFILPNALEHRVSTNLANYAIPQKEANAFLTFVPVLVVCFVGSDFQGVMEE